MTLYICLPLLAVLLQPALCLYNCSSEYERTPGWSTVVSTKSDQCYMSILHQSYINQSYPLSLIWFVFFSLPQTTWTWLLTVAPVRSHWRSTCARLSGQVSILLSWHWMGTTTTQIAKALLTPAWTLQSSATKFLLTTVRITPAVSRCRWESVW